MADRLSVFWGTPSILAGRRQGGRFPALDRVDLLENGRLMTGADVTHSLVRPTQSELLIAGAEFALEFLAGINWSGSHARSRLGSMQSAGSDAIEELLHPEVLVAAGVRRVTKLVLFPVRFMFTAATGRVGTNDHAVEWYVVSNSVPGKQLVAAALGWRAGQLLDEATAAGLLGQQMLPLYRHYLDDHVKRLDSLGVVALADAFKQWRSSLEAGSTATR